MPSEEYAYKIILNFGLLIYINIGPSKYRSSAIERARQIRSLLSIILSVEGQNM